MQNPIAETLGLDLAGYDPDKEVIVIYYAGRPWLAGQPRNDSHMTWEGYYNYSGTGPCFSIASGTSVVDEGAVLRALAARFVGTHPKKGQIAQLAATIRDNLTILREPRKR